MSWDWRRAGHVTAVVTSDWLVRGKIETQCKDFNGKGKLTVDDLYSVIKLQVWINTPSLAHRTKINFLHDYISNSPPTVAILFRSILLHFFLIFGR